MSARVKTGLLIVVLIAPAVALMVVVPSKPARFEKKLSEEPKPDTSYEAVLDIVLVEVKSGAGLDQTVELNSKPMQLPDLAGTLKDLLDERPDKTVFIKAPKDKPYRDIVSVIDVVKGAGATPIGLQMDYLN